MRYSREQEEYCYAHSKSSAEEETSGDKSPASHHLPFHSLHAGLTSIKHASMLCIPFFMALRNPPQTIPMPFVVQADSATEQTQPSPSGTSALFQMASQRQSWSSVHLHKFSPFFHVAGCWASPPRSPKTSCFPASPSPAAAFNCSSSALKAT